MKSCIKNAVTLIAAVFLAALSVSLQAAEQNTPDLNRFIAGLTPYQRPASAPVIAESTPSNDWKAKALSGVSDPVPASLGFLEHQGAWYTPFNRPGMPGYYDLRQWHQSAGGSNKTVR